MPIIPNDEQFIGTSSDVDMSEKKSSQVNSKTQVYTLQDFKDSVSSDGSLQIEGGVALDGTLRRVEDQGGNLSPLYLSTSGVNAKGSGANSTQLGENANASNINAVSIGVSSQATAFFSMSIGSSANSTSSNAISIGRNSDATADSSVSLGNNAQSISNNSIAIGKDCNASGTSGISIGANSDATQTDAIAIGNTAQATATGAVAIGTHTVGSNYSTISGGENNAVSTGTHATVVGGSGNTSSGQYSVSGGNGSIASGQNSFSFGNISGGNANTATGTGSVSIGNGNRALATGAVAMGTQSYVTGTDSVGIGRQAAAQGDFSVSGGYSSSASGQGNVALGYNPTASADRSVAIGNEANASGYEAVAIGRAGASGTRTVAIGRGANASGFDGAIAFVGGQVSGSGEGLGAAAFGRSKTTSIGGFSFGEDSLSYLRNQFSQSPKNIYGGNTTYRGESQASQVVALKSDDLTTGGTTVLSLDGSGTSNLIIPEGNNRLWNVVASWSAVVTGTSGTTTGVNVGDVITQCNLFAFKKIGGTSSIVGSVSNVATHNDSGMSTASMGYSAGASEELALTFTAPTFTGGGSVTVRVVNKIMLTEVAY